MLHRILALVLGFGIAGCQKISNNINAVEFECGGSAELGSYRYVKLVGETGAISSPEGLEVRDEAGRDAGSLVTPKGCLKLPNAFYDKLVVARPSANQGYVLYPTRIAPGSIQSHAIKTYRYNALTSSCKNAIVTSARQMSWPISWAGVESASYDWQLVIEKEKNKIITLQRNGVEELNREEIDLTELDDGAYDMQIKARQLFSTDKVETVFDCKLIVDRQSPLVSIDRDLVRLDGESETLLQAAPGEPIRIQTGTGVSRDSIHACLRLESEPVESCKFDQLTTGYVTAPQRGNWILLLYADDEAGNRGPFLERKLQVFDSNLVTTIRSLINQAELAQKAGSFLQSLVLSVKAYEKMRMLGSKAELKSVQPQVKKSVLESVALPHESLIVKNDGSTYSTGIGFVKDKGQTVFLRANSTQIDAYSLMGSFVYTVDFKPLITNPGHVATYRLCESTEEIVVNGDTSIHIFKGAAQRVVWALPSIIKASLIGVSQDCQYALIEVTKATNERRRLVMDLKDGRTFTSAEILLRVTGLLNETDRKQLIVEGLSGTPSILDLETGALKDLSSFLKLGPIQSIMKAKDGSTGILGKDQRFSLFNSKGELVKQIETVSFAQTSQVPDEYVLVIAGYNAQFLASDGSSRGQAPVAGGTNWTYLTSNENFLVGLGAGSNLVKIWTRSSNAFDEIYYKGDSIWNVMFSESGNLYISSAQANRVFQLQSEMIQRKSPQYWNALGLQFSADGKDLFYKEQQPLNVGVESYAVSKLVKWNLSQDALNSYPLPDAPLGSIPYPGFGSQMRDLEHFRQNGKAYVASTLTRGSIGIFDADDLSRPIEKYDLSSNWLQDIAVDPTGDLLAAANKNGLVHLVGRKNGGWGALSLTEIYPQYFEEYPVTLQFDKTGKFLFVTDLNRNLMKFAVQFNEESKVYTLSLVKQISQAGVNLALNSQGDTLAIVGQDALLKILDADLKELKTFELSPGKVTIGQSVAFSPVGKRIYAGVYDGSWNELDLQSNQLLKVRFSSGETGATNLVVSPKGDQIAFMGGGFVQLADLNVERVYKKMCAWLAPRLPYIPDLTDEDRKLCAAP